MPTEILSKFVKKLNPLAWPLLLVLCSKFYFLFGFFPGTWRPLVPFWVVLGRDLIFIFFLVVIYFLSLADAPVERIKNLFRFFRRPLRVFTLLSFFVLVTLIIQMLGQKSLSQILQHYLRNAFLPMLVFPGVLGFLLISKSYEGLVRTLRHFVWVNTVIGFLQIFAFKDLMWINRPTGILGDPILNSVFILIGLLCFDFKTKGQKVFFFIFLIPAGLVLYQANSFSAVVAFILAIAASIVVGWKSIAGNPQLKKTLVKFMGICFLMAVLFVGFSFLPQEAHREGADAGFANKITAVTSSIFCKTNCGPVHYSIRGRLNSNMAPIHLCSENILLCVVGDWTAVDYHRLDSTWASMVVNWGIFFLIAYLLLFLILPLRKISQLTLDRQENLVVMVVFFYYWFFCIFNAGFYKYPLNILFYISIAIIFYRGLSRTEGKSQRANALNH